MNDAKLSDLLKVYHDLERTLASLRKTAGQHWSGEVPIDIKKLIQQLNLSKQRIERKIGNTILLEKQQMKKRIGSVMAALKRSPGRNSRSARSEL